MSLGGDVRTRNLKLSQLENKSELRTEKTAQTLLYRQSHFTLHICRRGLSCIPFAATS